jgi:glycosyltransferase involved in cell wall biosynthesis
MKIMFIHDRFGSFAGAESNIFATAQELKRRGWTLGMLHGPATGKGECEWSALFESRFSLEESHAAASALLSFQPDLVYVHNLTDARVFETLLNSEVPLARMVHDHNLYCMRSYKYNYFTRQICTRAASAFCTVGCGAFLARGNGGLLPLKWVSYGAKKRELELNRQLDCLLVATRFMKEELLRNGFAEDRIEMHAPVPPAEVSRIQSSFGPRNLIIYSGQITRGKGVDLLINALSRLAVPFECHIFGDGNFRGHCERLAARLGLGDRVQFHGFVPSSEITRHYADCSVVAMSSVWPEPFGAAGLEGMRHGLPVVAFDAGGIREWLTDGSNGFLVPWMDCDAYALRLQQLLTDKALARSMGERARASVVENFSFTRYVDGLETLFERLAARAGRVALT